MESFGPRAVVTGMYPFGRRKLRFEMEPLIRAAKARGAVLVSSVRDILQRRPPESQAWMAEAARAYDHILVHADPALVPFDPGFAMDAAFTAKLKATLQDPTYGQRPPVPGTPEWNG